MPVIGIDLGTTNSLVCIFKEGSACLIPNSLGTFLTPSAVALDSEKTVWTGAVAKEKAISDPEHTAVSFKRHMGTSYSFTLQGQTFCPEELSALILKQLKADAEQYLGEPVEEAVISVPAYFNDEQRSATREAGKLAGLKVERLINEPSAAALACRRASGDEDSRFLVIDFGGGTLDVSVVECFEQIIEIQAVAGDNRLGGDDFDHGIADYFCRQHGLSLISLPLSEQACLLKKAEQCKRRLTEAEAAVIEHERQGGKLGLILTRQLLVEICASIFSRLKETVERCLKDADCHIHDIDSIVLAGGSCKMPVVQRYIAHFLGKEPWLCSDPDEIVAIGAGIYAGIKARNQEVRDVVLTDICPFTLGVAVCNHEDPREPLMSPIIERNSPLPISKAGRYFTASNLQTMIKVEVYQGEAYRCSQNLFLGELKLPVPAAPAGVESVLIRFTYDINGILDVEVLNLHGDTARKVILNKRVHMTEEELKERMARLEALKQPAREAMENQLLISRAEALFARTTGSDRQTLAALIQWFSGILSQGSPAAMAAARKKMEETLAFFEGRE